MDVPWSVSYVHPILQPSVLPAQALHCDPWEGRLETDTSGKGLESGVKSPSPKVHKSKSTFTIPTAVHIPETDI